MSCKDFWEKEMAGRLQDASKVAPGQVDGAQRCVVPGCNELVQQNTQRCVKGHVQGRRPAPDRARMLVDALRCYVEERLRAQAGGIAAVSSPMSLTAAGIAFACYARDHEQPGWKRTGVQTMLRIAEREAAQSPPGTPPDPRVQAAQQYLADTAEPTGAAATAGPDIAAWQMERAAAAMRDPTYQRLIAGAEQAHLYWAARANYTPPLGLYLWVRRGNRLGSARYDEAHGWWVGDEVEPGAGATIAMAAQVAAARERGVLVAEHCPVCGRIVAAAGGHVCPGQITDDLHGPLSDMLIALLRPFEEDGGAEGFVDDEDRWHAAVQDLERALAGEPRPGLAASLRWLRDEVLALAGESDMLRERLLRNADEEDFIHYEGNHEQALWAVRRYLEGVEKELAAPVVVEAAAPVEPPPAYRSVTPETTAREIALAGGVISWPAPSRQRRGKGKLAQAAAVAPAVTAEQSLADVLRAGGRVTFPDGSWIEGRPSNQPPRLNYREPTHPQPDDYSTSFVWWELGPETVITALQRLEGDRLLADRWAARKSKP